MAAGAAAVGCTRGRRGVSASSTRLGGQAGSSPEKKQEWLCGSAPSLPPDLVIFIRMRRGRGGGGMRFRPQQNWIHLQRWLLVKPAITRQKRWMTGSDSEYPPL